MTAVLISPKATPAQLDHQQYLNRRGEARLPEAIERERMEIAEDHGRQTVAKARRYPAGS
jgi:hypothetical protein